MTDVNKEVMELLDLHHESFFKVLPLARKTGHTVPSDTKSWSEILVSLLTEISGRNRKKGTDLDDGSDVKAANLWEAIDTPRFNGVLPAGRTSKTSQKPEDVSALDDIPYIFFVLWDHAQASGLPRCRIWVVRPREDPEFRKMAAGWYAAKEAGEIRSNNFQLHPPRNLDTNEIRNTYGNLRYPLLLSVVRTKKGYKVESYDPDVLEDGECSPS